jgi:hypothetical protein
VRSLKPNSQRRFLDTAEAKFMNLNVVDCFFATAVAAATTTEMFAVDHL